MKIPHFQLGDAVGSKIGLFLCLILAGGCDNPEPEILVSVQPEFRWQNLDTLLWGEILEAEDARATTDAELDPITRGLESTSPATRLVAVRALGRMERPGLVPEIATVLADTVPAVRAEAANALAQAVFRGEAGAALGPLMELLGTERDPYVRGVIAQALGRLPYESPDTIRLVDATLAGVLDDSVPSALVEALRGVNALVRRQDGESPPSDRALARLRELAEYDGSRNSSTFLAAQVRRLATSALIGAGRADAEFLWTNLEDPDPEVRRLTVDAVRRLDSFDERGRFLSQAMADVDGTVRLVALRAQIRRLAADVSCGAALEATDDPDPDVVLTAIDLLGQACGPESRYTRVLEDMVGRLKDEEGGEAGAEFPDSWHIPAHALVALANTVPDRLDESLPRFSQHENWWVRMYAARAAATAGSIEHLDRFANDSNDNVRDAAIRGLSRLAGHEADSFYITQLRRPDYQLIRSAAVALDSTPNPVAAIPALFDALERVTAERRETSRDARRALMRRIGTLGGRAQAVALSPYLNDFDPAIAELAGNILLEWTGRTYRVSPRPLPRLPLPTFTEMAMLAEEVAVLHMSGGGEIEITLFPFEAPTNVARFSRLARSGYFDGLTFHRIVRGFVIQGGSPGANEFVGDGPFTRDEISMRTQARGTVGVSVRGRDTGDAQIYVNIVDNPRLDHDYTIIGEVTGGLDVVDGILEGAVIERITWDTSRR